MKELDNIKVEDLSVILNKDAVLQRFYPLIPLCEEIINRLLKIKIYNKYMFLDELAVNAEDLAEKLEIDMGTLKLLEGIFHLYDFKNRKLREIKSVSCNLIENLIDDKIKTSKDYIFLCMATSSSVISQRYSTDEKDVVKLFEICDLMRLPGVKDLRADLYHHCGYKGLVDFQGEDPDNMRRKIGRIITEENIDKIVPLRKELSTQIAVAKVLPKLLIKK